MKKSHLYIDLEQTVLTQWNIDDDTKREFRFQIGSKSIAERCFLQYPPTPYEAENAILIIEDEIMPVAKKILHDYPLFTSDKEWMEAVDSVNMNRVEKLTREEIEMLFNRLSAIITGRPVSSDNLPEDTRFAAKMFILREIMHHFNFPEINFEREGSLFYKNNDS